MAKVIRTYKLGTKKETIEEWFFREITDKDAAEIFGVKKQNFPAIPATIVRDLIALDEEFAKAFSNALNKHY